MKRNVINPIELKGKDMISRMRELMGESVQKDTKNYVIELTKKGPDGKIYAIVRENHQYFIKVTDKTKNIVGEDFNYIGGLQNKTDLAYPSYSKAIKQLNLKFINLNEAYNKSGKINVFENDNAIGVASQGFEPIEEVEENDGDSEKSKEITGDNTEGGFKNNVKQAPEAKKHIVNEEDENEDDDDDDSLEEEVVTEKGEKKPTKYKYPEGMYDPGNIKHNPYGSHQDKVDHNVQHAGDDVTREKKADKAKASGDIKSENFRMKILDAISEGVKKKV